MVVVVEPDRAQLTPGSSAVAAQLAEAIDGHVVAFGPGGGDVGGWGARRRGARGDQRCRGGVAGAVAGWSVEAPWAVLAPSTAWGREVAARAVAHLGAGLTGDAVELEVATDGRLIAWKPAFGGQVAAIRPRHRSSW